MTQIISDRVSDYVDIEGSSQQTLAVSTSAAATSGLPEGIYDVKCDVNAYIKVGNGTVTDVTSSTGYELLANNVIPVFIRNGSKIGVILASGTGTLKYHKVG